MPRWRSLHSKQAKGIRGEKQTDEHPEHRMRKHTLTNYNKKLLKKFVYKQNAFGKNKLKNSQNIEEVILNNYKKLRKIIYNGRHNTLPMNENMVKINFGIIFSNIFKQCSSLKIRKLIVDTHKKSAYKVNKCTLVSSFTSSNLTAEVLQTSCRVETSSPIALIKIGEFREKRNLDNKEFNIIALIKIWSIGIRENCRNREIILQP